MSDNGYRPIDILGPVAMGFVTAGLLYGSSSLKVTPPYLEGKVILEGNRLVGGKREYFFGIQLKEGEIQHFKSTERDSIYWDNEVNLGDYVAIDIEDLKKDDDSSYTAPYQNFLLKR